MMDDKIFELIENKLFEKYTNKYSLISFYIYHSEYYNNYIINIYYFYSDEIECYSYINHLLPKDIKNFLDNNGKSYNYISEKMCLKNIKIIHSNFYIKHDIMKANNNNFILICEDKETFLVKQFIDDKYYKVSKNVKYEIDNTFANFTLIDEL